MAQSQGLGAQCCGAAPTCQAEELQPLVPLIHSVEQRPQSCRGDARVGREIQGHQSWASCEAPKDGVQMAKGPIFVTSLSPSSWLYPHRGHQCTNRSVLPQHVLGRWMVTPIQTPSVTSQCPLVPSPGHFQDVSITQVVPRQGKVSQGTALLWTQPGHHHLTATLAPHGEHHPLRGFVSPVPGTCRVRG